MNEFFIDYGLFALKAITLLLLGGALLALAVGLLGGLIERGAEGPGDHLEVTRLGDENKRHRETLEHASLSPVARRAARKAWRAEQKSEKKAAKKALKEQASPGRGRVFVLDFVGDIRASAVQTLRQEITAVLSLAKNDDEVVVRLESGGGMVHAYGLGASQLDRIRQKGIRLTVIVDRVAASGGYMMACVADQLLAAPFAVIGSIGVVAQLPNFHRLLKKHDVDFELLTAGEYKRTLTVFGENTEKARQKFRDELEETHGLFKQFVHQYRPQVPLQDVATGEVWFGKQALEKNLVDGLTTSDEYLSQACENREVLAVAFKHKQTLKDRLSSAVESTVDRLVVRWWTRAVQEPRP